MTFLGYYTKYSCYPLLKKFLFLDDENYKKDENISIEMFDVACS